MIYLWELLYSFSASSFSSSSLRRTSKILETNFLPKFFRFYHKFATKTRNKDRLKQCFFALLFSLIITSVVCLATKKGKLVFCLLIEFFSSTSSYWLKLFFFQLFWILNLRKANKSRRQLLLLSVISATIERKIQKHRAGTDSLLPPFDHKKTQTPLSHFLSIKCNLFYFFLNLTLSAHSLSLNSLRNNKKNHENKQIEIYYKHWSQTRLKLFVGWMEGARPVGVGLELEWDWVGGQGEQLVFWKLSKKRNLICHQ